MAEVTEKVIRVAVDGIEKSLADIKKVDALTAQITAEYKRMGKTIDANVTRQIRKAAQAAADLDKNVKGSSRSLKALGRELLSAGGASGGVSGLFGGIIGGFAGGALSSAIEGGIQSLYDWATAASEAQQKTRSYTEAIDEATESAAEEKVALEVNYDILTDTTAAYEDRETALEALQESYPDYFDDLDLDKSTNEELKLAYDAANRSIQLRIELQALNSLATEAYTKQVKAQRAEEALLAAEEAFRSNGLIRLFNTLSGGVDKQDLYNGALQKTKEAAAAAKGELEGLYDLIGEKTKQLNAGDTSSTTSAASSASNTEKNRIDEIKNAVTDLESARKNYLETTKEGSEQEIADAKTVLDYYERTAEAALKASGAVGSLTGLTNDELKIQKALLEENVDTQEESIEQVVGFFNLSEEGTRILRDNLFLIANGTRTAFNVFSEIYQMTGEVIYDSAVQAVSGGRTFTEVVNGQLIPSINELANANEQLDNVNKDLTNSNEQNAKDQASLIDLQGRYNQTLKEGNKNLEERNKTIGASASKAVKDVLNAIGGSVINFESESFTKILEAVKAQIQADFAKGGLDLVEGFEAATDEFDKLLGADAFQFDVDEFGDVIFKLTDAASLRLLELQETNEEAYNNIIQIVELFNSQSERLDIERLSALEQAEAKATGIYLSNIEKKNKESNKIQKEYLKNEEFALDQQYVDLLNRDTEYVRELIENKKKLGKGEREQILKDGELLAETRKELADKEVEIYTATYLEGLASALEEGNYQYVQDSTIEYINLRNEILKTGNKEALAILDSFKNLIDDADAGNLTKSEERIKKLIADITDATTKAAQLISNIFALVDLRQQSVLDAFGENISRIEEQISETTNKISELEDDLEGKRSGRREAILRGIEAEQANLFLFSGYKVFI